jgi:chlorobactene glucosyltransferase
MELVTGACAVSCLLTLGCATIACINFFSAPRLRNYSSSRVKGPLVSVLIPARNEAANLANALPKLLLSSYQPLEILVLDDGSTDKTRETALNLGVRCISGEPLPAGWTGKNWACWQLAQVACGEILLFMDADVVPGKAAVSRTVDCLTSERVAGLSCFLKQIYESTLLAAVVPFIMELPITGWIPLVQISKSRNPSLIAANGQWIAVKREAYFQTGGHWEVRSKIVEDIELGRRVRNAGGFKTLIASEDIEVRMYGSYREMQIGFSKNLFLLFGDNFVSYFLFLTFFSVLFFMPWVAIYSAPPSWALSALLLTLCWRLITAQMMKSKKSPILLHPIGMILAFALFLRAGLEFYRGSSQWKGRILDFTE